MYTSIAWTVKYIIIFMDIIGNRILNFNSSRGKLHYEAVKKAYSVEKSYLNQF